MTDTVVGIVSELTGYPPDLLDLDLDLEADLGVDTVKQAEVFAAIREHYGVARDDSSQAARLSHPHPRHRLDPRQDRGSRPGGGRRSTSHRGSTGRSAGGSGCGGRCR